MITEGEIDKEYSSSKHFYLLMLHTDEIWKNIVRYYLCIQLSKHYDGGTLGFMKYLYRAAIYQKRLYGKDPILISMYLKELVSKHIRVSIPSFDERMLDETIDRYKLMFPNDCCLWK